MPSKAKALVDPAAHLRGLVRTFHGLGYGRTALYTVFTDWVECAACALSNRIYPDAYEKREKRYLDIISKYDADVKHTFGELLGQVILAAEACRLAGKLDLLAQLYIALELERKQIGQYFTPWSICEMMARINCGPPEQLQSEVAAKGYITFMDPCCGAGTMLLACAAYATDCGILPEQIHFTGIDIDPTCVRLCFLQFALYGLPALIIEGNAISMKLDEYWPTARHISGAWSARLNAAKTIATSEEKDPVIDRPPSVHPAEPATHISAAEPAAPSVKRPLWRPRTSSW